MKKQISIIDIGRKEGQLIEIRPEDLVPLPYPYDQPGSEPGIKQLTADQKKKYESSLDGISAIGLKRP